MKRVERMRQFAKRVESESLAERQERRRDTFAKRAQKDAQEENKGRTLLPPAPTCTMRERTRQQSTASSRIDG